MQGETSRMGDRRTRAGDESGYEYVYEYSGVRRLVLVHILVHANLLWRVESGSVKHSRVRVAVKSVFGHLLAFLVATLNRIPEKLSRICG